MPLEQRVIGPIGVGRGCVPMDSAGNLAINIPNELECVTNGTLANIIRQLSSLSHFAEDLFATIVSEASLLMIRSNGLQTRIDRLAAKVVCLDSTVEEVSLQDIHLRKAFKSSAVFDQQVVSRDSIPDAIGEVYRRCDRPPPLERLNPYRDDGKDGLKFYTDPNYFFELWRQEMLADTERALADRSGRKVPKGKHTGAVDGKKRKVRQPANTRERYRQMMASQGEFIIDTKNGPTGVLYMDTNGAICEPNGFGMSLRPNSLEVNRIQEYIEANHVTERIPFQPMGGQVVPNHYHKYPEVIQLNNQYNAQHVIDSRPQQSTPTRRQASITSRPSQPPPAPPSGSGSAPSSGPSTPSHTMSRDGTDGTPSHSRGRTRDTLPPPPPPPPSHDSTTSGLVNGQPEAMHKHSALDQGRGDPPPPPPPPPALENACADGGQRSRPTVTDLQSITLKKTVRQSGAAKTDARSDLLAAIREGIKLKRVEDCKQREVEKSTPLHDVASILARRVAIELSDSEGGAEDDCDDDSDAWDDESEC